MEYWEVMVEDAQFLNIFIDVKHSCGAMPMHGAEDGL